MKKLWITAALVVVSATAAQAQINLDVNFGGPAYVAEPQPVIVEHPYLPAHYNGRDRHHEGRDWRAVHEREAYIHHDERHDERRR